RPRDYAAREGGGFFLSSRRRHTRFSRDWSSDVCSSDLPPRAGYGDRDRAAAIRRRSSESNWRGAAPPIPAGSRPRPRHLTPTTRSEERRVGKERRDGGAPDNGQRTEYRDGGGVRRTPVG